MKIIEFYILQSYTRCGAIYRYDAIYEHSGDRGHILLSTTVEGVQNNVCITQKTKLYFIKLVRFIKMYKG